jgi:hypothetical protein
MVRRPQVPPRQVVSTPRCGVENGVLPSAKLRAWNPSTPVRGCYCARDWRGCGNICFRSHGVAGAGARKRGAPQKPGFRRSRKCAHHGFRHELAKRVYVPPQLRIIPSIFRSPEGVSTPRCGVENGVLPSAKLRACIRRLSLPRRGIPPLVHVTPPPSASTAGGLNTALRC